MARAVPLLISMLFLLAACWGEPASGPAEIKYDRDACDYCRMIISDPRFATQIRQAKGKKAHKFDDIGDALHWLEMVTWEVTDETEFWVRDMDTGSQWLDARKAFYLPDQHSPMNYGYGALAAQRDGAIDFSEMRKKVLARGSTSRCEPGTPETGEHKDHVHEPASASDEN